MLALSRRGAFEKRVSPQLCHCQLFREHARESCHASCSPIVHQHLMHLWNSERWSYAKIETSLQVAPYYDNSEQLGYEGPQKDLGPRSPLFTVPSKFATSKGLQHLDLRVLHGGQTRPNKLHLQLTSKLPRQVSRFTYLSSIYKAMYKQIHEA